MKLKKNVTKELLVLLLMFVLIFTCVGGGILAQERGTEAETQRQTEVQTNGQNLTELQTQEETAGWRGTEAETQEETAGWRGTEAETQEETAGWRGTEAETQEETAEWKGTETETQEETAGSYKSGFEYVNEELTAKVVLSDKTAMSAKAVFVVQADEGDAAASAKSAVESFLEESSMAMKFCRVYNAAFRLDESEVEPAGGTASVTMDFHEGLDLGLAENEDAMVRAFHVTDGAVEDVTMQVSLTEDRKLASVGMQMNSFSPIVIASVEERETEAENQIDGEPEAVLEEEGLLNDLAPLAEEGEDGSEYYDNVEMEKSGVIKGSYIEWTIHVNIASEEGEGTSEDQISVPKKVELKDVIEGNQAYTGNLTLFDSNRNVIDIRVLPNDSRSFKFTFSAQPGENYTIEYETCTTDDGKSAYNNTVYYRNYPESSTTITGSNQPQKPTPTPVPDQPKVTLGKQAYVPVDSINGEEKKWVEKGDVYLAENDIVKWRITVTPENGSTVAGTHITDTIGGNQEYNGRYTVYRGSVDENNRVATDVLNSSGKKFDYKFPEKWNDNTSPAVDEVYIIEYETMITKTSRGYSNSVLCPDDTKKKATSVLENLLSVEGDLPTPTPTPTPPAPTLTPTPTVDPQATETPTPNPTPTPTSEPTPTSTPAPTATPTPEPTVTPTPEPTPTSTPAPTATPTPEPTVTPTPDPTPTPTPDPTVTPTPDPTPTKTPEPIEMPTPDPTATPTSEPTATPTATPTVTPTPAEGGATGSLHLSGVKRMRTGSAEPGAFEFELRDENGTILSTASNGESGAFSFGELSFDRNDIGKTYTYTVSEKIPEIPDQYEYDRTVYTVKVSIGDNGDGTPEVSAEVNGEAYSDESIVFVNDVTKENEDTTISVTKKLVYSGEEIFAVDQTYYAALYGDEGCTVRLSDIKALEFKNASASTVTFSNLVVGKTYYVGECDAAGNVLLAGVTADGTLYRVDFGNGNKVDVAEEGTDARVYFENQYEQIPHNFYKGADLTITKKLLDGSGAAKNGNESFYAGIFEDAEYTALASCVSQNIVELPLNGASEVSVTVQVALFERVPVTLYVTEVDESGQVISDASGFGYTVTVNPSEVTLSEEHSEETVVITNREKETSTTPDPTSAPTASPVSGAAETGDLTPLGVFTAAFVLAGAFLVWEGNKRKRNVHH